MRSEDQLVEEMLWGGSLIINQDELDIIEQSSSVADCEYVGKEDSNYMYKVKVYGHEDEIVTIYLSKDE